MPSAASRAASLRRLPAGVMSSAAASSTRVRARRSGAASRISMPRALPASISEHLLPRSLRLGRQHLVRRHEPDIEPMPRVARAALRLLERLVEHRTASRAGHERPERADDFEAQIGARRCRCPRPPPRFGRGRRAPGPRSGHRCRSATADRAARGIVVGNVGIDDEERGARLPDAEFVDVIRARVAARQRDCGVAPARRCLRRASAASCRAPRFARRWLFASPRAMASSSVSRSGGASRCAGCAAQRSSTTPKPDHHVVSCSVCSHGRCRLLRPARSSRAIKSMNTSSSDGAIGAARIDLHAARARGAARTAATAISPRRASQPDVRTLAERLHVLDARAARPARSSGGRGVSAMTSISCPCKPRLQRRWRVERQQPAFVQQRDARAALGLVEVRRRHHDGEAAARETPRAASRTRGATPGRRRSSARRARAPAARGRACRPAPASASCRPTVGPRGGRETA